MRKLNNYILEKLKLNKDIKVSKINNINIIKKEIIDYLKRNFSLHMEVIFDHYRYDNNKQDPYRIETIYNLSNGKIGYCEYKKSVREVDDLSDLFTNKDIKEIYKYINEKH